MRMGGVKSVKLILLVAIVIISCITDMDMSVVSYDDNHHVTVAVGPGHRQSIFDAEAELIFKSWMVKHAKAYSFVAKMERRLTIFKDNLRFITNRNVENLNYRLGLTRFADLSLREYREVCHRADPGPPKNHVIMTSSDRYKTIVGDVFPKSVDWRKKGAVTEIKYQGRSKCCDFKIQSNNF